ncbi:MAG TPA: TonB family protein [Anditalea sp.]|nr:TonB family protein [Anditalea sp.]
MAGIIDYIWQSTFCLFFLYGIYWCFLKGEKVFTFTRIFILIAPILALLFPLIEIPVDFNKPSISLENTNFYQVLSVQEAPEEIAGEYGLPEVTVSSTRLPLLWEFKDFFLLGYFIIVIFLSARILWQLMQLQMLTRKGWYETVYKLKDNYFLVPTFGLAPIFTFFDKLFWDDTEVLEPEEKNQIIQHEIEHIRQGHSYDVLFYQALTVLFWFNPAIHLMRTALVDIHEYLADEKVLKITHDKENYKKLIIRIAFKGLDLPIGNYFIRSTTLKRILMMKKSPKINWLKLFMVIPLTAMLLALVSMKSKKPILIEDSKTSISVISLHEKLLKVQDSLEVGIKVKKIANPQHYEYISPLINGILKAQLGELEYEISNINTDEEYIKVMGLITSLRLNSTISKDYSGIYKLYQVDEKPKVKGGNAAWNKYLFTEAPMPDKEKQLGLSNRIEVEFIVDINGTIKNPVIKRSFGGGLDEEFLAAIKSEDAPKWTPGMIDGEPVPVLVKTELMYASNAVGSEAHRFFPKQISATGVQKEVETRRAPDTYQGAPIYDVVPEPPVPDGGFEGWNRYLSSNLKYPKRARENEIEGVVYLVFTVTTNGDLVDPDILRGIGHGLDEEALRMIQDAPTWSPGKLNGEAVNVKMRLPIRFKLAGSNKKQEAIVGENAPNTLPVITVVGYGKQEKSPAQKETSEIDLKIESEKRISLRGNSFDISELDYYLSNYLITMQVKDISPDQITVNIVPSSVLKVGTLKDVESILIKKNLRKINYKKSYSVSSVLPLNDDTKKQPLIIVENKIMPYADFADIDPTNIETIRVLKSAEAKIRYGMSGVNGAMIVQLK